MSKPRILVADDESSIRSALKLGLEPEGYEVETVEDGDAALSKLQNEGPFNVLVTDVNMPRRNGLSLLKEVRRADPYVEVIVLTGYFTVEAAVQCIRIGASDYVCKPFTLPEIRASVKTCLEKQRVLADRIQLSELKTFSALSKALTAAPVDLDAVLSEIMEVALQVTSSRRGCILSRKKDSDGLEIKVARGLDGHGVDPEGPERDEGAPGDDARRSLTIPVELRGNTLGMLRMWIDPPRETVTERDQTLLTILANQAAVAVENARLYGELQSRIRDLQNAIDDLHSTQAQLIQSEKLAALGRFAAGIAHEVKNPLAVILGGLEYLQYKLAGQEDDVRLALAKMKESTTRANDTLLSLLRFTKPSPLKREIVVAQSLIEETLPLVSYRGCSTEVAISTEACTEPILVSIDKNQIEQVLLNILINALESMPNGGRMKLRVGTMAPPEGSGVPHCAIQVIDSGEGITKENLARLFEPFFTTKSDRRGNGLGLCMSKIIVENHGGRLLVESESGKGTTVTVVLPAVEQGVSHENQGSAHR